MSKVQTLDERKQARVEEIRAGFARLREELVEYGRTHGGRFWLYGSAVTDRLRFDSYIDILVDFDDARRVAALDFVEERARASTSRATLIPRRDSVRPFSRESRRVLSSSRERRQWCGIMLAGRD
jgi:predicted nucleotidyltransferase